MSKMPHGERDYTHVYIYVYILHTETYTVLLRIHSEPEWPLISPLYVPLSLSLSRRTPALAGSLSLCVYYTSAYITFRTRTQALARERAFISISLGLTTCVLLAIQSRRKGCARGERVRESEVEKLRQARKRERD